MADAVILVDDDGSVRYRNAAARRLFETIDDDGLPVGLRRSDRAPPVAADELPWARALRGERVEQEEFFLCGRGGADGIWLTVDAAPIAAADAGTVAAIVTMRDITSRKRRWLSKLETLVERAEQDKVQEIAHVRRQFVLSISHALRTPLTSILGYTDLLLDPTSSLDDDEARRFLQIVNVNADRLRRLLDESLELQELLDGALPNARAETSLRDIVRAALTGIQTRGRSLRVIVTQTAVRVDRVRVERAVNHLVRNAVRHTPDTTSIVLRADVKGEDLFVTVEDDGPGVPEALKEHIFEPFTHTDAEDPNPGQGIGLALARRYAQLHGGDLRVEDAETGGARFVLVIRSVLSDG